MEAVQIKQIGPKSSIIFNEQPKPNSPIGQEPEIFQENEQGCKTNIPRLNFRIASVSHPNIEILDIISNGTQSIPLNSPSNLKLKEKPEYTVSQPRLTVIEVLVEILGLTILAYNWAYFVTGFKDIPNDVPLKYYPSQQPSLLNKNFLILLVLGDTFAFCLLSILQMLPHKFKYLVEITSENNLIVFLTTRRFILYIKIVTLVMVLYITIALFNIVKQDWNEVGLYLISLFSLPYSIGGWVFYKRLIKISINPYA